MLTRLTFQSNEDNLTRAASCVCLQPITANHGDANRKWTKIKAQHWGYVLLRWILLCRCEWRVIRVGGGFLQPSRHKTNKLIGFFFPLPRRAWNSWLPKMADTLPTLLFKVCSSGLVRLAWYRLRSPTARSVSVKKRTTTVISSQTRKHAQLIYGTPRVLKSAYQFKQDKIKTKVHTCSVCKYVIWLLLVTKIEHLTIRNRKGMHWHVTM